MNKDLVIKKCLKCGAMVKVIEDCHCDTCGLVCCGEVMHTLAANSVEAAVEKHVPTYEIVDGKIKARVNHVMEEDHFIEWICLKTEDGLVERFLSPEKDSVAVFDEVESGTLYAYCNKHGLWKTEIGEEKMS